LEKAIEQIIREGMARGEFDNLSGKGKPLDLTDYFNTPEELRMAYSLLKSNEFVPEEIDTLNEIARLKQALCDCTDDEQKRLMAADLQKKQLALAVALEKYRRKS